MKKTILFFFIFLFLISSPALAAEYAPSFLVESEAVYMYNLDSGEVIYQKNADKQMPPAALATIMTCVIALEEVSDLDHTMVTYPTSAQDYLYQYGRANGSIDVGGMMAGEEMTMRQMLYGMMLPNANEATMSIAYHLGDGSSAAFAQKMNDRARELGAVNTNFTNATGFYDPEQYTTAYDMFLIARHAYNLPDFMEIVSTVSYETGPTNLHDNLPWKTTNRLILNSSSYYYAPVRGIKASSSSSSGSCAVSTASKDGFTYMLVVMGGPTLDEEGEAREANVALSETKKLYSWAFDAFQVKTIVEKGRHEAQVPLRLSLEKDTLLLMTGERFTSLVPTDVEIKDNVIFEPILPEYVEAPVQKGQEIGTLRLILLGEEIGTVPLVAAESVGQSSVLAALDKLTGVFFNPKAIIAISAVILLIVLYIILAIIRNRNMRKHRGYRPRRRNRYKI